MINQHDNRITNADKTAVTRNRILNEMRQLVEKDAPADVALFDGVSSALFVLQRFLLSILVNHAKTKREIRELKRDRELRERKPEGV